MAADQRRQKMTTTVSSSITTSSTTRSHSAPPRKKWYKRAGPLLSRQRSTHQQQDSDGAPVVCSMLYDQMVSRRLVGAIAAWHDLHASLLQLSLNRAVEQKQDNPALEEATRKKQEYNNDGGNDSSSNSSDADDDIRHRRSGKKGGQRKQIKNCSGKRPKGGFEGCKMHYQQHQPSGESEGENKGQQPITVTNPTSSMALGTGMGQSELNIITAAGLDQQSPPLTVSSSGEDDDDDDLLKVDRPDIDEPGCSSSPMAFAVYRRRPAAGNSSKKSSIRSGQTATWSATFAQSLKIRSTSTRRRARSPLPRARSPAPTTTKQIIIKHSVQLVPSAGQIDLDWSRAVPRIPALLRLANRPSASAAISSSSSTLVDQQHRRCFSLAKVDDRRIQQQQHQKCTCLSGEEAEGEDEEGNDDEEDDDEDDVEEYEGSDEEEEEWENQPGNGNSINGAESDAELDSLYEKERNRPKMSISSPELTPEQLKQLFPELSEHWRYLNAPFPL